MKFLFRDPCKINEKNGIQRSPWENHKNLKNHRYPLDNNDNMQIIEFHLIIKTKNENLRNPNENKESHENVRNLCENHENHINHKNQ